MGQTIEERSRITRTIELVKSMLYNITHMSSNGDSPEVLRTRFEVGDNNELNDLIRGMSELADASGRTSGTQFAVDTLAELRARGLEVNPFSMGVVLRHAFGDPEELLSRMEGRTAEELDEMLPGEIGAFAVGYLAPVIDKSSEA